LSAVQKLINWRGNAGRRYPPAIRWMLDQGITTALWGAASQTTAAC
jgi:hypothetical protein